MNSILELLLQISGLGLILLAILHIPVAISLRWKDDVNNLTPVNQDIFHVHSRFICLVLIIMGVPCLIDPLAFIEISRAGLWVCLMLSVFWGTRLYAQWFWFRRSLWSTKRLETAIHIWFTIVWTFLTFLFSYLSMRQLRVII